MTTNHTPLHRPGLSLLALIACLSGCDSGDSPSAMEPTEPNMCVPQDPHDSILVNPTPALPGDACAEPPTPISSAIEGNVRTGQEQAAATRAELLDPTRITVVTCGTGNPLPSGRAQSCLAVFAGGQFLLFDAGDGAQSSMEALGLPADEIAAVFLTHFHSDHMADLGEVISRSWILGRTEKLPVYGGPGVERIVDGFNLVYGPDEVYRKAHHGEAILPSDTLLAEARRIDAEGVIVYERDGVVVRAYAVDHSPVAPSFGFRVEHGGRAIGISGDTIGDAGLVALAEGVDVLVSEVMAKDLVLETACALERTGDDRNAQIFRDIRTYHIDVSELAQVSRDAGVGTLVLVHMVPLVPPAQAQVLFTTPISSVFDGEVVLAEDGTRITVDIE